MRKITSLLFLTLGLLIAGTSCKKFVPYGSFESMTVGAYVTLVKSGNSILDYGNLNATQADITVKQYGSDIKTIKIYATEGSADYDKNNWKFVKEYEYNGGDQQLVVKATELAAALGIQPEELKTGFQYTFYNQLLLKDGRVFDPANTAAAFIGISNYNMALTWNAIVVCPFSPTGFAGSFEVLEDGWADYSIGDIVQVTEATANSITIAAYPNPSYGGATGPNGTPPPGLTKVDIDPATGAASVKSQMYGGYIGFDTEIKVKTAGDNNWVFSCAGTIILKLNHKGGGDYGDYALRLKKL